MWNKAANCHCINSNQGDEYSVVAYFHCNPNNKSVSVAVNMENFLKLTYVYTCTRNS